jgi:ABC-type ATPase with predicted acetyltransferase domain
MFVERGTKADWDLLHDLHYKAEKLPLGPRFWRLDLRGETIGVIVTGSPKGMLRERHIVFPKLKPGGGETKLTNTNRYNYINANFRVISRFVIDTMYRGIGAGYRMMNLVSRMEGNTFMEIQSSMSKFNVFGQKAGFQFVKPMNANKFEAGMKFFRSHFEATPQDFEAIVSEIEKSPNPEKLIAACREFYQRNSALENTGAARDRADARVAAMTPRELIKGIQQISLASPMYGIWKCPDVKGSVPDRMPLTAFDAQKPTEKLKWIAS